MSVGSYLKVVSPIGFANLVNTIGTVLEGGRHPNNFSIEDIDQLKSARYEEAVKLTESILTRMSRPSDRKYKDE